MVYSKGIRLKKKFGQHFLRDENTIHRVLSYVDLDDQSSVFEIGCGDGFLTRALLQMPIARLWVFEIDPDWVLYVRSTINDARLTVFQENILDVDFARFQENKPWVLMANLPYQITFPILHLLQRNKDMLKEAVIMIQEEVAQKLAKTSGRGYGFSALFFQHYFYIKLGLKVPPSAFYPPPKVYSRLVYLKPRREVATIPDEQNFWKFIKACFHQPRRTLKNNLEQSQYATESLGKDVLALRAQQMDMQDFLRLWQLVRV